jgi:RNA polymerase sigma-70 factor (ECF subfamily)
MAISTVRSEGEVQDDESDDNELAAALAARDYRRALTLLMKRHGDRIYRYALGMTGDPQLADEVRQVVFVEAYRDLPSFAGRAPVLTWLFGIARHRCLDAAKTQRRWNRRYKHDPPEDAETEDDPAHELDRPRLARMITKCLRVLAPAAREAVALRYQQDLPYEEIAVLIGQRVGTVQQRVARALPVLRRCVDAQLNARGVR